MSESQVADPASGMDLKSQAVQAAEELRSSASQRASQFAETADRSVGQVSAGPSERAEQLRQAAETGWEEAKVKVHDLMHEGEVYVREHPGRAVATAVGVGFVLGLLFRR